VRFPLTYTQKYDTIRHTEKTERACKINFISIAVAGMMSIVPAKIQAQTNSVESMLDWQVKSIECLALNMYHEARDQGTAGIFAVSSVVINRVKDKRFPNNICDVIYQGPVQESWKRNGIYFPIKNKCQFSWYCDGKSDIPHNKKKFQKLLDLSELILYNEIQFIDITDGALFYHADYITPGWAKTKQRTTEIGDHIFYTWKVK